MQQPIPFSQPQRHRSLQARISWGEQVVTVGGDAPVRVQSMTNTDTADAIGTAIQVKELALAGSELVRITVDTPESAKAVPYIREQLDKMGVHVPLIGDFHYNGHRLLTEFPDCAKALSKYRINPGNVGKGDKHDKQFAQMIEAAIRYDKAARIGVNWGSLDQELLARLMDENASRSTPWDAKQVMYQALVTSALESAELAERLGLAREQIILSCKMSGVQDLIAVYRELALTPQPGEARTQEVLIATEIIQALGVRSFVPSVAACPGCGRTTSTTFQELAMQIDDYLRYQMPVWRKQFPGVENLKVAVMGCIVNGPGESKHADIGISLPGNGEAPAAPVFIDGEKAVTLRGDNIAKEFHDIVENYVHQKYAVKA